MTDRRIRLLVIDDSPEDHEAFRRALAALDAFEFDEAFLGAEGLERCRADPPDCVILDHRLPDMDALAFLDALTHGLGEPPVPVVVVTGQGNESVAVQAMKSGAHDYLTKGASTAEIERAIRVAIERHGRRSRRVYRVLIIDDSPEDRVAYRRRLDRAPGRFDVREAETSEEGLALGQTFAPDCVLLDYHLPDSDGIETLIALRREWGDVAVLMLTGQGNETVAVRALKAGAEDYLVKGPGLDVLPQAIQAAVERVSLRRSLEEQRRELIRSRNELRVTLASIGDAVIATDTRGRVTFLNAVAESLTGWSSDEAQGRELSEVFVIIDEETRERTDNPAIRALREGMTVGLANHTLLIAKDGVERPIDDSAAPIRDSGGEVFGAVLVFRDVTERRQAERSLLLQSRVLDSMVEGVSVADEAGHIFYTNPAEDRMLGYERGELIGKHIGFGSDYEPEESDRRLRAILDRLEADGTWVGEWRNRRKDGSTFTSFARITALELSNHRCVVWVQEDVTDRNRLKDELQDRIAELALEHKRKDEFLAMLAHELRNPLAPLKNALHVLRLKSGDWKTVDGMRQLMERQLKHLGRLVDDLLDVSRITQGKVTLKLERLDLARLARECTTDHTPQFHTSRVSLALDTPETPVWITGDATRLTQVFDNFLTNSLKFTNPGANVVVKVRSTGERAELSVRDDGIGIDGDVLPTVFDVFAQADKSLHRSPGGLGLGLAIVKGLVNLHGGTVEARSEGLGRGTEMIVSLPLEQEPPALAAASGPHRGTPARRRILVIEDNRDSAESLQLLLEVNGYDVRVAYTGPDGVRAAMEWAPEVVICDIGLPGMDGFAVAEHLRRQPSLAAVQLIAVTGYGRPEDVEAAMTAGFDAHMVKPADPDKLLARIETKKERIGSPL